MNRKEFFNQLAPEWAKNDQNLEEAAKIAYLIARMGLKKGQTVLDAGCGTGRLIPFISQKIGPDGRLIELDFSERMLQLAALSHKRQGVYFILADVGSIPFRAETFDAIVCFGLFPHLEDKPAALKEFRRILVPTGTFFVAHAMSRNALNTYHSQVDGPVKRDFLPDAVEMKNLLAMAGFKTITIEDKPAYYLAEARP